VSSEIEVEPIAGLPHALPPGEQLLWQGRPAWKTLARQSFELPWLAAYFGVFALSRGVVAVADGKGLGAAVFATLVVLPLAALCLATLALLGWLNARATVYTITSRRVVMRFGVAFPMTFNLPFTCIGSANLKTRANGNGDIALELSGPDRLAWLHLWPHARPWKFAKAQPMLRAIDDAPRVANVLAAAVTAWAADQAAPVKIARQDEPPAAIGLTRTPSMATP
jgi:Bacterial PH domain